MRGRRSAPLCAGLAALALVVLAGCASAPSRPIRVRPWPQRRARLQALDAFALRGRVAVVAGGQGFDAHLDWRQHGRRARVELSGPLGIGGVRMVADGSNLNVETANGRKLSSAAARQQLVARLGFEPPLGSLRYWLLGVPDPRGPAREKLDLDQRVTRLQQYGWRIDYLGYTAASGYWLPQRLSLSRDDVHVHLYIDHWQP